MSKINLRPIGSRIVIEQMAAETMSKGGIIIPEIAQEKPQVGTVMAVGDTQVIKTGDKVLFGKYGGTNVTYADKNYLIMKEEDVYAVLD